MKNKIRLFPLCLSFTGFLVNAAEVIEPIMVEIPAGSFMMGYESKKDALPLHKVAVPRFNLGKYEVTVKEFRLFVEATGYEMPTQCTHELNGWFNYGSTAGTWQNNSLNNSEYQPVNCIGWKAAEAYTKWLAKETGLPYRLPTEAEWEYAARANTTTEYYFGDDLDKTQVCDYENIADLSGENILQRDSGSSYVNFFNGKSDCADYSGYASVVGMYKANPFGLHDMVSNVVEFIADCYKEGYEHAPTDGSAYLEEECQLRSTRGGSWHWNAFPLGWRGAIPEDFVGGVEGFRVALEGDLPITSKNTQAFQKDLNIIQNKESLARKAMQPYPDPVTNLKLEQKAGVVTLTWAKSITADVEHYRVYRNDAAGRTFKLLAANIFNTEFKDANLDNHQYEYTVVAVRRNQQSDYSNVVSTKVEHLWTSVPGKIEAESAISLTNSSIARTSDDHGHFNLTGQGGIGPDAVLSYQIDVKTSGYYRLSYRVASPRDTKGFNLNVGEQSVHVKKLSQTGGYHQWQTQVSEEIYLDKGQQQVTIKSLDNNWKLNWIALTAS